MREEVRDDGISASAYSTKSRPGYARLADVLRPGDVLAVWELSRATRQMTEYVALRDLCAERGVLLFDGTRVVDLAEPTDAYTTAIGMATAEYESARTRSRILRSTDARAQTGKPYTGLGFGFDKSFDPETGETVWSLHPTEAPLIAQAVADVLAGVRTPYRIARDWNAAGVTSRTGRPWTSATLLKLLRRESIAALRVHRGVVQPVRGNWPAIISEADRVRLLHVLDGRTVRTTPGAEPSSLLSAIAVCGDCGTKLRTDKRPKIKHGERIGWYVRYRCPEGHVSMLATKLEPPVERRVIELIEGARIAAWLQSDDESDTELAEHLERAAELEKRLTDAADAFAEGAIGLDALKQITAKLNGQIEQARAAARAATDDTTLRALLEMDTVPTWRAARLEDRRRFVRAAMRVRLCRGGVVEIENIRP